MSCTIKLNRINALVVKGRLALISIILQALTMIVLLVMGLMNSTDIVIIYALETILIGLFHVLKMLVIHFAGKSQFKRDGPSGIGLILFFMVHYGFFVFVQTGFFFMFLSMSDERINDSFGYSNYIIVSQFPGVKTAAIILTISLVLKFFTNFLHTKRYSNVDMQLFMFVPYVRILIQQFTAIIPGFFIIFFDAGLVSAIILILTRTTVDLFLVNIRLNPQKLNSVVLYLTKNANDQGKSVDPETMRNYLKLTIEE